MTESKRRHDFRHSVVEWRTCACGCGVVFALTTQMPKTRRFANRWCWKNSADYQACRRVYLLKKRKAKHGALIAAVRAGTVSLHDALEQSWQKGYQTAYQAKYYPLRQAKGRAQKGTQAAA